MTDVDLAPFARLPALNRRWLSICVIVMVYIGLALVASPDAYLSTDVGGKTASLQAMESRGDWNLDMGYWLDQSDPGGQLYPLAHSRQTANGKWVNTTSLPMVYAARPLWAMGGPRFGLLLPIAGGVACAVIAGSLATRIRPTANGVLATWIVGLAGPVAIYAFDFWEHTLGLAAMAFGVLKVMDAVSVAPANYSYDRRSVRALLKSGGALSALAGLSYGVAATMRQEALVYGFIGGVVLVAGSWRHWGVLASGRRGATMLFSAMAPLAAHSWAEVWLLGGLHRVERSATIAETSTGLSARAAAAAATSTFPFNGFHLFSYVGGALLTVSLVWAAAATITGRQSRVASVAALVVWSAVGVFLVSLGPRFVPGLVPTTPLAVVGAVALASSRKWTPFVLGLGPVPLLFATQYAAGAIPQWGGRYLLLTGLVLMTAAIALLQTKRHQHLLMMVSAAGLAVTVFGATWSVIRMNTIADQWGPIEQLSANNEVVVWRDSSIAREAGPLSIGNRWISAPTLTEQQLATIILDERQIEQFVWVDWAGSDPPDFEGFEPVESLAGLDFLDQELVRYEKSGSGAAMSDARTASPVATE